MSDGGKGSSPRPFSVSQKQFDSNWDLIFSKKKTQEEPETGAQRVNNSGQLERYHEGYWQGIENRN